MNHKKIYLLTLLFIVCILSIQTISATENTVNKDVISANNKDTNLETNIPYNDVSTSEKYGTVFEASGPDEIGAIVGYAIVTGPSTSDFFAF